MLNRGLVILFALVLFCAGQHAAADVDLILIVKTKAHLDGVPVTAPYGASIMVMGGGITSVSVAEPNGANYVLDDWGGGWWGVEASFAGEAARDAAFGSGDYDFTFNGGADTVTVSHTQTSPVVLPNITFPQHLQTGVGPNPTCEWDSMAGAGDGLALFLTRDPNGIGEDVWEEWPVDINTTSRQIGPLDPATEYQFEVGLVNIQGDNVQNLQTDQGDDFQYVGVAANNNAVIFETAPIPDLTYLFLTKELGHMNGVEGTPPYFMEIWVVGANITSATVTPPGGGPIDLEDWGDGWGIDEGYASLAALNAAWPSGDYDFTFNNGFDTVTVSHTQVPPGTFPNITSPGHQSTGVGPSPTCEWDSVAGAGDAIALFLVEDPDGIDEDVWEEWPVDINTTSRQIGPLDPATEYEFEAGVVNIEGGNIQSLQTDQGDDFQYVGVAVNNNAVTFETAPMPDIEDIWIARVKEHENGIAITNPWWFEVDIEGTDITGGTVTSPGTAGQVPLGDWGGEWGFEQGFASQAALETAFSTGDYVFSLNGGFATVTINYNVAAPTGFADVIDPEHGDHNVGTNPTITWGSVDGLGEAIIAFLIEDPDGADEDVDEFFTLDTTETSWEPNPLADQTEFELEISVANLDDGGSVPMQTDQGDDFTYEGWYDFCNVVCFDTLHWPITGDVTGDCKVNILDMLAVRDKLGADADTGDNWWMDVTEDGEINILDMLHVRNHLTDECPE